MTPEQINMAIAEECGYKNVRTKKVLEYCDDPMEPSTIEVTKIVYDGGTGIPNYYGSLDAMHEAEKLFKRSARERDTYGTELTQICANDQSESRYGRSTWNATAPQRAEAFLRTVGKWIEKGNS